MGFGLALGGGLDITPPSGEPIVGGVGYRGELVAIEVVSEAEFMRTAGLPRGTPDPATVEGLPAGAAHVGDAAGWAPGSETGISARIRGCAARFVLVIVVETGHRLPVPRALRVGLQAQAVQIVQAFRLTGAQAADGVQRPVDRNLAVVERLAGGVAQIALGAGFRVVLPQAAAIGGAQCGREVIGEFEREVVLDRMIDAIGSEHQTLRARGVLVAIGAAHRGRRRLRIDGRAAEGGRGIGHGLALRVQPVGAEPERTTAHAVGQRGAEVVAVVALIGAVDGVILHRSLGVEVPLETFRVARADQHHAPCAVAGIQGGERSVDDIDTRDFLGRHHAPAWRIAVTVAEEIGQQQPVGIDNRARAVDRARRANRNDAVAIADVALAHQHARQIFQRLGRGHGVDRFGDQSGIHARGRSRKILGNRRGTGAPTLHHHRLQHGVSRRRLALHCPWDQDRDYGESRKDHPNPFHGKPLASKPLSKARILRLKSGSRFACDKASHCCERVMPGYSKTACGFSPFR